jgi:hypothetical protein
VTLRSLEGMNVTLRSKEGVNVTLLSYRLFRATPANPGNRAGSSSK